MLERSKRIWWDLKNGIKNLFIYFPIIWKTREFDYGYLVDLFQFKLKLMKESMLEQNIIADKEIYAQQMQDCIDLITRLQEENYFETYNRTSYVEGDKTKHYEFDIMLQERELDYKRLFNNLKNNIEGWWW